MMSAIAITAGSKIVSEAITSILHSSRTARDTVKERLDPVSLLAIVALMRFQLPDTKMHIGDHCVTISHSSDYTYLINFRGLSRSCSGDSREDLALIKSAIKTVACWQELHDEENVEIREFMDHVGRGLDALIATYVERSPTTTDALEYYKLLIEIYKSQAPTDVEELNEVTLRVMELWDKRQISELNGELIAMEEKQGSTPLTTKILCKHNISLYLAKLQEKGKILKQIYSD